MKLNLAARKGHPATIQQSSLIRRYCVLRSALVRSHLRVSAFQPGPDTQKSPKAQPKQDVASKFMNFLNAEVIERCCLSVYPLSRSALPFGNRSGWQGPVPTALVHPISLQLPREGNYDPKLIAESKYSKECGLKPKAVYRNLAPAALYELVHKLTRCRH